MKKRILHVDDDEGFSQLLKLNLEKTGQYEVRTVNDPVEAANVAREFKPDLMLLDVIMPVMFGGDVANQFEADPELKNIRIVFLSASMKRQRVEEHHGIIGGYAFIAQPAPLNEIISRMESVLSGPWPLPPPPQPPASSPPANASEPSTLNPIPTVAASKPNAYKVDYIQVLIYLILGFALVVLSIMQSL